MKVYIGYDPTEDRAAQVAAHSLREASGITAEFLKQDILRDKGLLTRLEDTRGHRFDLVSGATCSTQFSNSRFLTPLLAQGGPALFVDCDMVFYTDPNNIFSEIGGMYGEKAVWVVKHNHVPTETTKMMGQMQTKYNRKNWSSVMLFNCDHPANRRLSLQDVNSRPGRDLHAFYWLADDEIGELDPRWNWLVNVQPKPTDVAIAHFTLGGPFNSGWAGAEHDALWLAAEQRMLAGS